jgi:hypothetical protein
MTLWHCKRCGSTDLARDAFVLVNDPDTVIQFDAVTCNGCGSDKAYIEEREHDDEDK